MTYSLIHAMNLIYEQWVTLGQDNIYTCTITQSDSQVCKLFILIITVECESVRMLFCFSRSSVKFKGHRGQKSTPTCACWWLNAARLHYNSIANVENHYTPAQRSWWEGILDSPCPSVCPSFCRWHGFRSATQVCFGISISYTYCLWLWAEAYWFSAMSLSKFATWRLYWIFDFLTLTLVWLWISSSNFSGTSFACTGRSILIFSNVTFKMATWGPYWILQYLDSVVGMDSAG